MPQSLSIRPGFVAYQGGVDNDRSWVLRLHLERLSRRDRLAGPLVPLPESPIKVSIIREKREIRLLTNAMEVSVTLYERRDRMLRNPEFLFFHRDDKNILHITILTSTKKGWKRTELKGWDIR